MTEPARGAARSAEDAPPSGRQVIAVLVGSGAIGFFIGAMAYPTWHDALEPAQVLAGLVTYPQHNLVYIYSTRTLTVLHELLALLLSSGVSERTLALLLSGAIGMLSLQALGLVVLAVSGHVQLATLSPVFILLTNATAGGVTYPVYLMGAETTYGVIGLSYGLLTIGLIGAGQARWGALLLGFGPALHPTIGALMIVAVVIAGVVGPRSVWHSARGAARYFLAGVASAVLYATFHVLGVDPVPPALDLPSVAQHWDAHRQPFRLLSARATATYFSAILPALWLWRFQHDVPEHARTLLRILVAAAVLGGTLSASYWLIPPEVPNVIPALMPSRLLNLNVISCMALIIGLSWRYRQSLGIQATLATLIVALPALSLWASLNGGERVRAFFPWVSMGVAGVTVALLAAFPRDDTALSHSRLRQITWLRRATTGALAATLLVAIAVASAGFGDTLQDSLEHRNDGLFAAATGRPGLLLTARDLHLVQLRTRRPVLLDGGALDALLYVPDAAPETDRILQRVYGTTLASLQQSHEGFLRGEVGEALWQARTPAEWQDIAQAFGVTDVLTDSGWTLQLPVLASSTDFVLYEIPRGR